MKNLRKLAVLAAVLALSASALAATLPIGSTTIPGAGTFAGVLINGVADPVGVPGDSNPFDATYAEGVFVGGANPYCATCLNFAFTLSNTATGSNAGFLDSVTITSFSNFLITLADVTGSGDTALSSATVNSGIVKIFYANELLAGHTSDAFVIFTNATSYNVGTMSFQDGTTANVAALTPAPEPSSLMLMGTGLMSAAGMLVRRRRSIA